MVYKMLWSLQEAKKHRLVFNVLVRYVGERNGGAENAACENANFAPDFTVWLFWGEGDSESDTAVPQYGVDRSHITPD